MQYPSVIVAAGSIPAEDNFYRPLITQAPRRIAADAGLRVFFRLDILPDLVVGDADSVAELEWNWALQHQVEIRKFPTDKDATDTQLALEILIEQGEPRIILLGGIGNRLDHTLANLYLLNYAYERGVVLTMIHPQHEIELVTPEHAVTLHGTPGDLVSLLTLTDTLEGVQMEGLRWNVASGSLRRGSSMGISNYLVQSTAKITTQKGLAFVMKVKE